MGDNLECFGQVLGLFLVNRLFYHYNMHIHAWRPVLRVLLATGAGKPPAVKVWTGNTVSFASRSIPKSNQLHFGRSNPDLYLATCMIC